MSALLDGCTAIARGAWEGGASFAAGYPGSPVTGVLDATAGYPEIRRQWAANEKIALETALGAAWSGARALVVMKHVGLNVAADPLYNAPYTGVRGALVIVVGDDPGASSSQNEQDTRLVAKAAGVPVLEPSSVAEALVFTRLAF
ncbi:MAG TPA: indolepyruvate ferredoxin oxidoreductase subunit alpha, partial [Plasticicumulans sp.]|nr:indolepyruvate ferredoxin oxidoreductase subunit alpha [Plasticicumulans sp.]